jgi:hypothetical protein
MKYGLPGLSSIVSPISTPKLESSILFVGRVADIILDDSHPLFNEKGKWNSIGSLIFTPNNVSNLTPDRVNTIAKPLFPNIKLYPLINELVTIISLPNNENESSPSSFDYYYFPPINIWNSQHHNAVPYNSELSPSQQKNYQQVEGGSVRRITTQNNEINLGDTFQEKANIYPLLSYEGDYILEGRWGNSIRFGSTVKNANIKNTWSNEGNDGDPIIIIRNGQKKLSQPGWEPTIEDINGDDSSIYLTSTQKIPLFPSSDIRESFSNQDLEPENIPVYKGKQILLNSGRLVFNASQDSILFSSNKTINISANREIHLNSSDKTVINTGELYLGSRQADERLVKGDTFVLELKKLLVVLEGLAKACTTLMAGPFPIAGLNAIGPALESAVKELKRAISGPNPKILSKDVRTK